MHFLIECAIEQLNQDFVWSQLVAWNSGNRPVTIDSFPILGKTSLEGLWVLSGTFRDGLHMSPLLATQVAREIVHDEVVFAGIFRPERPPISMTKSQALSEIVKHYQAAWAEHRAINSTKMGLLELPEWLHAQAESWYSETDSPYVMPPEFYPMIDGNPTNTAFIRAYYRNVEALWDARTGEAITETGFAAA